MIMEVARYDRHSFAVHKRTDDLKALYDCYVTVTWHVTGLKLQST